MNQPLLPLELQVVASAVLLAFLGWVVALVRWQRLSLRDSLLWVVSTCAVLAMVLFPGMLRGLARALAIEVPSNALFALAILYLALNVLSITIALSGTTTRERRLAQECALLRAELDALREELRSRKA